MDTKYILSKLIEKQDLTFDESTALMTDLMEGSVSPAVMSALLIALRAKGESPEELLGFITVMRDKMQKIQTTGLVIDTCGTGGDGTGTFNISTTVAFVVAGAGVQVAKHGNRAASSKSGSADVLEALGINITLSPGEAEEILKKSGMVFLFAPLFHPSMKFVGPVRKELGVRTVFNFLGPFVSPAGVKRQIVGIADKTIAKKIHTIAHRLNYEHLILVNSDDGLDEVSTGAPSEMFATKGSNKFIHNTVDPAEYGFKKTAPKALTGGDAAENARILISVLEGEKGARRDIVILNSAFALYVSGAVSSIEEGIKESKKSIDSGSAKNILQRLKRETQKYAKHS